MPMKWNATKRNADSEAAHRRSKRGGLAISTTTTTTSSRCSGRGTIAGGTVAAVITSFRCSGHNTIVVVDAAATTTSSAPNAGGAITATSLGHSQPTATSSGHRQPTINTGYNLDIHDTASLPVPAILGANDNVSVCSSSEDDSSMVTISTTKKITSPGTE